MSSANWLLWIFKELNIMRSRQSEESINALFKKLYKRILCSYTMTNPLYPYNSLELIESYLIQALALKQLDALNDGQQTRVPEKETDKLTSLLINRGILKREENIIAGSRFYRVVKKINEKTIREENQLPDQNTFFIDRLTASFYVSTINNNLGKKRVFLRIPEVKS